MSAVKSKCLWCGKTRVESGWEQKRLRVDEWATLCKPCARRRLANPWNALLSIRLIEGDA